MESLLFSPRGTFSISSSIPGEYSFTRGDGLGSFFTYELVNYLDTRSHLRRNWKSVLESVSERVQLAFRKRYPKGYPLGAGQVQSTQTLWPRIVTPRLGLKAALPARGGPLEVDRVIPLSPADAAGIRKGDLLLAIDRSPIDTLEQYGNAVDNARQRMRVKIRRGKNEIKEFNVELNPPI